MKNKTALYNGRIHTMDNGLVVNSMIIDNGNVVAVGDNLHRIPEFKSHDRIDLKKKMVTPGFVDAHTHFYFYALSLGRVNLQELNSLDACLKKIKTHASSLPQNAWLTGEGYTPDLFKVRTEPDRHMLDSVSGGRPAFIYAKDQHSAWVNTKALEIAGITSKTKDPAGGSIVRDPDRHPTGILREGPAISKILQHIPSPSRQTIDRLYQQALDIAYRCGLTGVHSFDGPDGFAYFTERAEQNKLGLRINYYPQAAYLPALRKTNTRYGCGDTFLRVAGIKIFADGSLGSRTALCFNKYKDSKDNRGIEVTSTANMISIARNAAKLGFPCAVHAIGDRAAANVLDAFAEVPVPPLPVRHRIEHLQLVRRRDLARVKRLGVVASMQPPQLTSDIDMMRSYWGHQSRNAYLFRTIIESGIPLAFGSDVPIEPLDPIAGIAAAVRRARKNSRDVFEPAERITAESALRAYTVGPAIASGQQHCRSRLMPGYPADFVVLSQDITRVAPMRIYDTEVLATVLDGAVKHCAFGFVL